MIDSSFKTYLACDLGAESSRVIAGRLASDRLEFAEVHRFPSLNATLGQTHYWDILYLYRELCQGLSQGRLQYGASIAGVGIDAWGVDYGLLDEAGHLLELPIHYRDARTQGAVAEVLELIPAQTLYEMTGIQVLQLNTLFQLYALRKHRPWLLQQASTLLMIPDLLNYFFTGAICCEYTNASTTQLCNLGHKQWDDAVLEALAIPRRILPRIVAPGSLVGMPHAEAALHTGLSGIPVIAPCTHDTNSAVVALPAVDHDWAYISCGTWSVLGTELRAPIVSPAARAANFTNEGGFDGRICFHKNIMGLWLLQQCLRQWNAGQARLSYEAVVDAVQQTKSIGSIIDIDASAFFNSDNMLQAVISECQRTRQAVPDTIGEIATVILESLVLRYRQVLGELATICGKTFERIHMVGGGAQNQLLCQWTANATGCEVIVGPFEATAIGNIAVQAIANGDLKDLAAARALIAHSTKLIRYQPMGDPRWAARLDQFNINYAK